MGIITRINAKARKYLDNYYRSILMLFADGNDIELYAKFKTLLKDKETLRRKASKLERSIKVKKYLELLEDLEDRQSDFVAIKSRLDSSLMDKCSCDFKIAYHRHSGSVFDMKCLACGKHYGEIKGVKKDDFNFFPLEGGEIDEARTKIIEDAFCEACEQVSEAGGYNKDAIKSILKSKLEPSDGARTSFMTQAYSQ